MEKLISQKEISQVTGLPREFVSFALATVKPVCRKGSHLYNIDEARIALIEYCEKRAKGYAKKADYWNGFIDKSEDLR